ncbi:MAG: MmgE/PrpD family protein [Victivallales bacterium]|nr:MmgE/PrpD family protein [Victivallales bacterium]
MVTKSEQGPEKYGTIDCYPVYHSSGTWGSITSAAVTAKLSGFSTEQVYNSLGIAEWQAPVNPMMRCIDTPSMCKDGIGWGCTAGVSPALMAREGFTGCPSLLGYQKYSKHIDSIGKYYNIMELYFKPYACCRWAQPGITGVLKILKNNKISPDKIEKIIIYTFRESAALNSTIPENSIEAQYNISFPVASTVLFGKFWPEQLMECNYSDQKLIKFIPKIVVKADKRFDKNFPQVCSSEVEIVLDSGKTTTSGIVEAKGGSNNPMTEAELLKKFRNLVSCCLKNNEIDNFYHLIST